MSSSLKLPTMNHSGFRLADRVGFVVLLGFVLVITVRQASARLPNSFFWWDDAGQYWMSQGQAHGFAFQTQPDSVWSGVELGRNGSNLDPIGFTILLRGWLEAFGTSAYALRLLPFIFFVASLIISFVLGRVIFRLPLTLSLAIPFVVLFTYLPLFYSSELRAFSLEVAAVLSLAALTVAYGARENVRLLIASVCIGLAGMIFSRYSFVIAVVAATSTLVFAIALRRNRRWKAEAALALSLAGGSALFVAWNIGLFSGVRQTPPRYYTGSMDLAESWNLEFLARAARENFLRNGNVLTSVFLAVAAATWIVLWRRYASRPVGESSAFRQLQPWQVASVFVLTYEMTAIAISALGLSPWWASGRWSIGLYAIAILSGFGLIDVARFIVQTRESIRETRSKTLIFPLLVLPLALLIVTGILGRDFYRQVPSLVSPNSIEHPFVELIRVSSESVTDSAGVSWRVNLWLWPSFRMLWETQNRSAINAPLPIEAAFLDAPLFASDAENADAVNRDVRCSDEITQLIYVPLVEGDEPETLRSALLRKAEESECQFRVVGLNSSGVVYALEPRVATNS
jgi:hypothetical protein